MDIQESETGNRTQDLQSHICIPNIQSTELPPNGIDALRQLIHNISQPLFIPERDDHSVLTSFQWWFY